MDSKDHPVVQQGIKAAELMSEVNEMMWIFYVLCTDSFYCKCS